MEQGKVKYIDRNSEGITFINHKEFECKLEQLDRIEKKLDKLLDLVKGEELTVKLDGVEIADAITTADRLKRARI